jgi:hypothetical protein
MKAVHYVSTVDLQVNGERIIIISKEPDMDIAEMQREPTVKTLRAATIDMKLEIIVIPVSDVDRAKRFCGDLGFSLDLDYTAGNGFRMIQATLPGSGCSVIFGKNVTRARSASYSTTRAAFSTKPVRRAWSAVQIRHENFDARRLPSRFIKP